MATAQLQRTQAQGKTKTWESIFPNEQLTEQKSALFVKKLLAVAISNITYLRAIFPEHAFGDKCLEDLNLKILRDESSCPGACQVIKWVKGCFDALEKKYLKTLVIGIYVDPDNPETVIESYTFKFTYNNNGEIDIYRNEKKISSAYSSEETKKATIRLLRTLIILTNTLTSLPDDVMMTMKLFYYDEVTPSDYEPPGFKASNADAFKFVEEATNISVGEVATPFHVVKMRVKTGSKQFEMHEEPIEGMEQEAEVPTLGNTGLNEEISDEVEMMQEVSRENTNSVSTLKTNMKSDQNSNKNLSPTQPDSLKSPGKPLSSEETFNVRCPCGCNEDDGLMVMCSNCKFWQHGICFLIKSAEKAPADHICDVCAKPGHPSLEPTDPHLYGMSQVAVQATCLWRRSLSACSEFKRIVAPQLGRRLGVESTVAQGLINRLEKEGFLKGPSKGKKLGKTVDLEKLKNEGIPRYLKTPESLSKNADTSLTSNKNESYNQPSNSKSAASTQNDLEDKDLIGTLTDKTNKINIQSTRRRTRSSPASSVEFLGLATTVDSRGKRGKKRAFSRTDNSELELANSQEFQGTSAKKKASTVTKAIAV